MEGQITVFKNLMLKGVRVKLGLFGTVGVLSISMPSLVLAQVNCQSLKSITLPSALIESSEVVPPTPEAAPSIPGLAKRPATPAYCRVKANATPTADSKIGFEVWLPIDGWNGELLQVGNGGLGGSIVESAMALGLTQHFAVAGTDDGHKGAGTDGSWAIGHPEKVVDFGYRAVHQTSVESRIVVRAFYGREQKKAFFSGCSEGGREALMEAQRFPADFDGILSGSPAASWTGLMTGFAWNAQALLKDADSYIPAAKRKLIEAAALKACGKQDGITDSFIKNPLSCQFDPSELLCAGEDKNSCLTAPQLSALKRIYSGARDPVTGDQLYPGYEPGAEGEPGTPGITFASYLYGSPNPPTLNMLFSSAFYGGAVANVAGYSSLNFDFSKDVETMREAVGRNLDATNPDLEAYKARGGKLLQYHGWYDGSPSPLASIQYYRAVETKLGGLDKTQDFYRLYMAPGVMHCGQGPGPNMFGNLTDSSGVSDAGHNIFSALRAWVEEGREPNAIIATKYQDDDVNKGKIMTRPLCPFPRVAKWNRKGPTREATSFSCERK